MEELLNKVVVFDQFGGPDSLKVIKQPIPHPKIGEIRIKVSSIGLNRAEQLFRAGMFIDTPPSYPASLGYECSGIVDLVGDGCSKEFKVGDKVSVLTCAPQSQRQSYAQFVLYPESSLVKNPSSFDHQDSSSLWMAYLTAYYAFKDVANLESNQWVLITAGSSSTGLAAIQLAKLGFNAKVIVTSRTSDKKDRLLSFGADYFIATDEVKDIYQEINNITGGERLISLVYDAVGGQITNDLSRTLKQQGHYILYGLLSGQPTPFPLIQSFITHINFKGYILFQYTTNSVKLKEGSEFLLDQFNSKKYKSIVGKVYKGIDSVIEAHKYLDLSNSFGKTIVEL